MYKYACHDAMKRKENGTGHGSGGNVAFLECHPLSERVFEWVDCSDSSFPWALDGVQCTVQLPGSTPIVKVHAVRGIVLLLDQRQCLWIFTDFGLFIRRLDIELEAEIDDIGFDGKRVWMLADHQLFSAEFEAPE